MAKKRVVPYDGGGGIEIPEIEWNPPKRSDFPSNLNGAIEYNLAYATYWVLSALDTPLITLGSWVIRVIIKILEKSTGKMISPMVDMVLDTPNLPDELRNYLRELKEPSGEGGFAGSLSFAGRLASGAAGGLLTPLTKMMKWAVDRQVRSSRPDIATLAIMEWRETGPVGEFPETLAYLGWPDEYQEAYKEIIRPRLSLGELTAWRLRHPDQAAVYDLELQRRGYAPDIRSAMRELLELIPPVPDLIKMAVREAWRDDIAAKYGYDEDFPAEFAEWAAKQGLTPEWAKRYWRAHWILPGPSMGAEMLHRTSMTEDDYSTLLKIADYPAKFRDWMTEIAYRTYTRVDVRRMFNTGDLNEAEVLRSYQDLGYPLDKAKKMTAFTINYYIEGERESTKTDILTAYFEHVIPRDFAGELLSDIGYTDLFIEANLAATDYRITQRERKDAAQQAADELTEERELTKADILSSYLDKVIDEPIARGFLADLGYSGAMIDLLIDKTDYKEVQRLIREVIRTTQVLYVNEDIGLGEVHERLGAYNLPAIQVEELILRWNVERERRVERPSVSQFLTFYVEGIMEEPPLREQLAKHKFAVEYIDLYVANADRVILEKAKKEAERETKERERLERDEFRTDRMLAIQILNVQIADWRVLVAELKTMMVKVVPPGTKDQMRTQIRVKGEAIATHYITIAEYREEKALIIERVPTLEEPEDLERLQAELLRLDTLIAGVVVQIAELRLEVATIRTELSTVVEPDERLEYLEQISLAKEQITRLQLEKTKVPVVYIPEEE